MDSTRSGNSILAGCDMKTEGLYKTWFLACSCCANERTLLNRFSFFLVADYCVKHQCQNDAKCVNRETNYTCACNSSGWTGKYCEKGSPFVKIISHFQEHVKQKRQGMLNQRYAYPQMSMNVWKVYMVVIPTPFVITLWVLTTAHADQD